MAATINPDLQKERDTATFCPEHMTYVLDGAEGITQRRREVENMVVQDPVFAKKPFYNFLSREEKYADVVRRMPHYLKKRKELGLESPADSYWYTSLAFPNEAMPLGLHSGMFLPTINNLGTPEQKEKWLPLAQNFKIIGTYAQTELGHGTHVRGLETIATYDPRTEEFIINSPTLTSYKWWPGALGKTCNYVVLMAQLYSQGKKQGIQAFMVQIRDMETHEPLPGVTVGDIGTKFGYESMDNGFLGFDNFRIPRENMLMKNAQVLKDGTFVSKPRAREMSYGTMVFIRAMLVSDVAAKCLAEACTIAIRYSCVRRQSELKPGAPEPQIMDFQTQQYKLLVPLASAYAYWFAGRHMRDTYFQINYEMQRGNTELLPELHAISAGLKAFSTWGAMFGIEQCRLSCGGHGYSHASGIPKIYLVATPGATYEGENTVMMLQTARYLLRSYQRAQSGEKFTGYASYLCEKDFDKCVLSGEMSLDTLVATYKYRAKRVVQKTCEKVQRLLAAGKPQWEAWNLCSVQLVKASTAHCHYFVVLNFVDNIRKVDASPAIKQVLTQLCQLYATHGITENAGEFLESGYMSSEQLDLVQQRMTDFLAALRPNAVALVDSFDFKDYLLDSILGRYDGQVYENMYKWAKESPLNKSQVHESYYKYLQPMMKEASSKL